MEVTFRQTTSGATEVLIWDDWGYQPVCRGVLQPFPGSEQMWISRNLEVSKLNRGQGWSNIYNSHIKAWVKAQGGRAIVASVQTSNKIQHSRLTRLGWKRLSVTLWMTTV